MVYVSFDGEARAFRDMARLLGPSWLCAQPHCDEEGYRARSLQRLSANFGELPSAVVLGPPSRAGGRVTPLNRAALASLLSDPAAFPWRAKAPAELLLGPTNQTAGGAEGCSDVPLVLPESNRSIGSAAALAGKRYVGLYFSASW